MSIHIQEDQKPIIAVLTIPDINQNFRGNRNNFHDIVKTGRELNYPIYVVTTKDLKLSAQRVLGYTYYPEKSLWTREWFPLPDIIYNRIPLREDEKKPVTLRKINECLNHPTIEIYNPFFFNKWNLIRWLQKSPKTKIFVPVTKRLANYNVLEKMLGTYHYLYLKPESGKAGKGIMVLKYVAGQSRPFRLIVQTSGHNHVYKATRLTTLWSRIQQQIGQTDYIIQEGISLTKYQNRLFDLRILAQKTGRGHWAITGIGARLAGADRITTHVPQGGRIEDPDKLLRSLFSPEQAQQILSQIGTNSLIIAKQIEKASGQKLGEMSMDLGLDENGKVWFFEANARPMKFDEPHIRKKSLERIFQYSDYLYQQHK